MRIIPGKTKVGIELFRGITIADMIIGTIGFGLIVLVVASSLPAKLIICCAIFVVFGALLVRVDDEPLYKTVMSIVRHLLAYDRHFIRTWNDETLKDIKKSGFKEVAFENLFVKNPPNGYLYPEEETSDSDSETQDSEEKKTKNNTKNYEKKCSNINKIIGFKAIRDGLIQYENGYYGAVIEIPAVEFRFFSSYRRNNAIETALGCILRNTHPDFSLNIVKLDRPLYFDQYLRQEKEKIEALRGSYENSVLKEDEIKARIGIIIDRMNELQSMNTDNRVVVPFYYIVLYDKNAGQLRNHTQDAIRSLSSGGMSPHCLNDKELAVFLKYSNCMDFDERDIEHILPEDYAMWAKPQKIDIRSNTVVINDIITHNFRLTNYPLTVGDAWLAGVMKQPGTKVVIKAQPMDSARAIRTIDHSLQELRGQYMNTGVDSKQIELTNHIESLERILGTLQNENEILMCTNIYITAYDMVASRADHSLKPSENVPIAQYENFKKLVRRTYRESGFRLNSMLFSQTEAFIGGQINGYDPLQKEGRGIPSNTVAATFPWIYASIADETGVKFGDSSGVPVFIDFFRRDSERVNSNMVIVGKSGSGKSYATKSILTNLAAEDSKIFVLDPEDEYSELAKNLHGKYINVGNAQYGRLNPFQIITALDDDEEGTETVSGSYATHLQFLEEFFAQILPDCNKDALEYLNAILDRLYTNMGITAETDLRTLRPEDYPIFDDLYDAILEEFQASNNDYIRTMLRTLMNYVSKFAADGRNANIWNGPSTVTTEENFTVFNFQSLLANRNGTVANAQMLLVLKYIDNEIIKNREYNTRYNAHRKVVVVIDEAHVFIDAKYPVALDFMYQLAKRIRKYNGMQIVITQNIKDFVGSEEIARKSAAIINACQYSFIFSLAPNDISDLCKLYEKAGGISEVEQEEIITAPRGKAFTIMSAQSRSTFQIRVPEDTVKMFRDDDFESNYFTTESGRQYWEDFVAESRFKFEKAYRERHPLLEETAQQPERQRVTLTELTEEELQPAETTDIAKTSLLYEEFDDFDGQSDSAANPVFTEITENPTAPTDVAPTAPALSGNQLDTLLQQMSGVMQTMKDLSYEAIMGRVQDMMASRMVAAAPAAPRPEVPVSKTEKDDGQDFNPLDHLFDDDAEDYEAPINISQLYENDNDSTLQNLYGDSDSSGEESFFGTDTVADTQPEDQASGAALGSIFEGLDEFDADGGYRGTLQSQQAETSAEDRQSASLPNDMNFDVAGFDFMQQLSENAKAKEDTVLGEMERNGEKTRPISLEELTVLLNSERFKNKH